MSSTTPRLIPLMLLVMVPLIISISTTPVRCSTSEKLDESSVPETPNSGIKCSSGCSSCVSPCDQRPPPPPPSPPPPPPPPKSPSSNNCPPPPSAGLAPPFISMTGPPGNLYPVDPYYSGAGRNSITGLPVLLGSIGLLAFW